jgi:carbamoyltransferase
MNILGFNPNHHGSVCLLQDGEIKHFIQEERIGSRTKYMNLPFKGFIDILQNYKIDYITWGAPSLTYVSSSADPFPYWQVLAHSYHPNVTYYNYSNSHHLCHVSHSFYNSGFKKCLGVVIDGAGSFLADKKNNIIGQETESIFVCKYPGVFTTIFKNFSLIDNSIKGNVTINLSQIYETVTMHLGWSRDEAGKTMGLAPYGQFNSSIPPLFVDTLNSINGNPQVFYFNDTDENRGQYYNTTYVDEKNNPQLKLQINPKKWHYNESKITNLEKDLAWKIQNDTQQIVGDYIEKAIKETGLKQVCCAGGYFLNCVTNYYLVKRFPDIEFYFEPIANDAGTAVGAAKLLWHKLSQDSTQIPQKTLYYGPQYSKEQLLKGIKKYVSN